MPLVIDTSAIVLLALTDEDALYSNAVLVRMAMDGLARVPPLFWDELTNVLVTAVRAGRLDLRLAEGFLLRAGHELPLATVPAASRLEVLHTAHDYGLSAYDAAYLALAVRTDSQLATHDRKLIDAASRAGVGHYALAA